MELPGKQLLYLSKRIGARGAGTDGEVAAASYVKRFYKDQGINVDTEHFTSSKSDLTPLIVLFLLCIGAYFLFLVSYTVSFLLSAIIFVLFQMETYSWSIISQLFPKSGSSNVIGRIVPGGKARKKVIITANYDTSKNSPLGNRMFSRFYNVFYWLAFISITAVTLMGIAGLVGSLLKISDESINLMWIAIGIFPAYLLLFTIIISIGEIWGRYQIGANDNGSGLSVLLCAMAELSKDPLEKTEVWGVATGRGFAGGRGMAELYKKHKPELKDAYIINLDHLGKGEVKLLTREGPLIGFRCNNFLRRTAFDASSKLVHARLGKGKCRVKKSDGMVALARGLKAVTIGGNSKGGTYHGYRSSRDTSDAITRSSLDQSLKIVLALTRAIDSDKKKELKLKRPGKKAQTRAAEEENAESKEEELILQ